MSNVSFSLDQLSNLVNQNEKLVKGLSKWFYSEDEYVVFTNKNQKTIDGLLEYDAKSDDRIVYDDSIKFISIDTGDEMNVSYYSTTFEEIDAENSYRAEYIIKLDDINDYNRLNEYDIINLKDGSGNILHDFILKNKLGNKQITIYSNFHYKNDGNFDLNVDNKIDIKSIIINGGSGFYENSRLFYNISLEDVTLNKNDLMVIDNVEYIIDDFISNDDKNVITLREYFFTNSNNPSIETVTTIQIGNNHIMTSNIYLTYDLVYVSGNILPTALTQGYYYVQSTNELDYISLSIERGGEVIVLLDGTEYDFNISNTIESDIVVYFGDGNILSPKLIYKDLIQFPTMKLFSKFQNSNKPLLTIGTAGELLLGRDVLIDSKINGMDTDDDFRIFLKDLITIFDKNGVNDDSINYYDLDDGYYRVYIRTNVDNKVNSFQFSLDVVLAPQSLNYENIYYTQIGGIYLVNNVIQSVWDTNNKPNLTFDEIDYIIENFNTYPKQKENFWYINKTNVDITKADSENAYLFETYKQADFNEAKLLVEDLGDIYYGVEYLNGEKFYSIISKDANEVAIYKYNTDSVLTTERINIVCII